jgi:hypothetical protein
LLMRLSFSCFSLSCFEFAIRALPAAYRRHTLPSAAFPGRQGWSREAHAPPASIIFKRHCCRLLPAPSDPFIFRVFGIRVSADLLRSDRASTFSRGFMIHFRYLISRQCTNPAVGSRIGECGLFRAIGKRTSFPDPGFPCRSYRSFKPSPCRAFRKKMVFSFIRGKLPGRYIIYPL